jgi:hypothetical protein
MDRVRRQRRKGGRKPDLSFAQAVLNPREFAIYFNF